MVSTECPIEVIDTESVSMGIGLLALEAAKIAGSGKNFKNVVEAVRQLVPKTHLWALFDTLKYLAMGGRIGKSKACWEPFEYKTLWCKLTESFSPALRRVVG